MDRDEKLRLSSLITLSGFLCSIIFFIFLRTFYGLDYPYTSFLFRPNDRWMDFINLVIISDNPYLIVRGWPNFPFLYKIAWMFNLVGWVPSLALFLYFFIVFFGHVAWINFKSSNTLLTVKNVLFIGFLSYPFLFSFDRANFELIVFVCLYFFIYYYKKYPIVATMLLSVAVALKVFPAIFAILFLFDKKYKHVLFVAFLSLFLTFVSYATMPGGLQVNFIMHLKNMDLYNLDYGLGNNGLMFGNSLFGAIKFLLILFDSRLAVGDTMRSFMNGKIVIYYMVSCLVAAIFLIYIYFVEKRYWKKVTILVFLLNLFPLVSGDYKLLHIFIPFFLFINADCKEKEDWVYVILFCILLVPKSYFRFSSIPEVTEAVLLNPLFMLVMMVYIALTGLKEKYGDRKLFSLTSVFSRTIQ